MRDQEISVSNLDLIAYLMLRGFSVDRTEQSGRVIYFVFRDPENKVKLEIAEYYRDGLVPARAFNAALKQAKDMMFQLKREISQTGNENEHAYKPSNR